jgi:sterol desaturase/sphingolipid hydroxylase (fatty acid hydroxylase superfamily)
MSLSTFRQRLRADLESPAHARQLGSGWLSGVIGLVASIAGFCLVIGLRYPAILTMPELRAMDSLPAFRLALFITLIVAFSGAILNLALRRTKILGGTALGFTLVATLLGGAGVQPAGELTSGVFLGLDWFVLNVVFTGLLFIPLERLFARHPHQHLFREEWREDLFYYLVSSLLVQCFTYLSFTPARWIASHTQWTAFRAAVGAQPSWLQFVEIMFLTDLVQYWVHRAFHRVPALWKFHAVHHSARSMDWMASARMHFLEIVMLRGATVVPMTILGFHQGPVQAYILTVYVHSTLIHANLRWNLDWLGRFLVTPRFHHWHHGIEKEAIDVNFAIHFPWLDRLFGTLYWPKGQWPSGYGVGGHPVPRGYWPQFAYPFRRKKQEP